MIRETACTIGTVARPPQVIIEMLGDAMWSAPLTAGETMGPRCAGVRSTVWMPASA
ncbi:hypothetical protein GCM10010376_89090 [Streptomyces violaceusniger]